MTLASRSAVLLAAFLVAAANAAFAATHHPGSLSPAPAPRAIAVSRPSISPPADMNVHAGQVADQVVYATDPDGDALTFLRNTGPRYMTVTTTDSGAGLATGNIHLAPSLAETGRATGILGVYDGIFYEVASFGITVSPALKLPTEMTVSEGATADMTLVGYDSEGHPLTFTLIFGPGFASVTTTSDSTGNVHVAPGFDDAGYHAAYVSVSDGIAYDTRFFQIHVVNVPRPPILTQPSDMHGVPNTISEQVLTVSNPDGNNLTYTKVSGPAFMSVGLLDPYPPRGYVRISPTMTDTGTVSATVGVSDGFTSDQESFLIRVDLEDSPPALAFSDIEVSEGTDQTQRIVAFDPDRQRLDVTASGLPPFVSFTPQPQPVGADTVVAHLRLTPNFDDAGAYSIAIRASDGWMEITDTLRVTVLDAGSAETSLRLGVPAVGGGTLENEYSSVDGTFTVEPSPEVLRFRFVSTSGSGAHWTILFGAPLSEGGDTPSYVNVSGTDTTAATLAACSPGSARIRTHRITRGIDGAILSFWATFEQTCFSFDPDTETYSSAPGFHGEVRYQVPGIPITLVAPRWVPGNTGTALTFPVKATTDVPDEVTLSASGVPSGATFLDRGGGQGVFNWTPARLQVGKYRIQFIASTAGGLADTLFTTVHVESSNKPPRAFANGPYFGFAGAPIPFSSSGTSDPEGDPLTYRWTFGDGGFSDSAEPLHAYLLPGPYPITLTVSDGLLAGGDNTLATIYWPDSARAFQARNVSLPGPSPLLLQAGGGQFCVAVEIVDAPTIVVHVDRFSFTLAVKGPAAIEPIAADPTTLALGDADGNGTPDITACFTRESLRRLFDDIHGRRRVNATISFSLSNGRAFNASLPIDVIGPDGRLRVVTAPNPFRPSGMLSFVTSNAGPARLTLFDSRGRHVRTVFDVESLPTGYHDIPISARGDDGRQLSSGVYFYRLETKEGKRTGRLAIIR